METERILKELGIFHPNVARWFETSLLAPPLTTDRRALTQALEISIELAWKMYQMEPRFESAKRRTDEIPGNPSECVALLEEVREWLQISHNRFAKKIGITSITYKRWIEYAEGTRSIINRRIVLDSMHDVLYNNRSYAFLFRILSRLDRDRAVVLARRLQLTEHGHSAPIKDYWGKAAY